MDLLLVNWVAIVVLPTELAIAVLLPSLECFDWIPICCFNIRDANALI